MASQPVMKKSPGFISLRVKLLVLFTLLFAGAFAVTFYWFYDFATRTAVNRIEQDLRDTWNGALKGINGDEFAELAQSATPEDESGIPEYDDLYDTPLYMAHQEWLAQIHRVEPRAVPYTYVKSPTADESDQRLVQWVGDIFRCTLCMPERYDSRTRFLEAYDAGDSLLYDGLSEINVRMSPQPDTWGTWVSAYGPIRNAAGDIVGALGVDFDYNYVLEVQQAIKDRVVIAFVVAYAALFALIYLLSRYITRPIVNLTTVANRIAEGDYNQDVLKAGKIRFPDEIQTLASVFDLMIDKVRVREETLKKKVEELRIEIDEVKRQKQVEEIVESDFFRDLQSKARNMRDRSRRSTKEMKQINLDLNAVDSQVTEPDNS
jgi:HAMP domain-containing protein